MNKLDNLKGLLSVRSINTLKRMGYKYLEDVSCDMVEKRVRGKKTKREILEFIQTWNSMDDDEKIVQMKKADVTYDVEMYEIFDGEFISNNGNWTVTKNGIFFNYEDASHPVGDMEDVPEAVQKVYEELQEIRR